MSRYILSHLHQGIVANVIYILWPIPSSFQQHHATGNNKYKDVQVPYNSEEVESGSWADDQHQGSVAHNAPSVTDSGVASFDDLDSYPGKGSILYILDRTPATSCLSSMVWYIQRLPARCLNRVMQQCFI